MRHSIRIPSRLILAACLTALTLPLLLPTSIGADDIDHMVDTVLSGTRTQRIQLAKSLEFSGITVKRLFDAIDKVILDEYASVGTDKYKIDEVSWLCKGLATSGRPEYKKTFDQVLASGVSSKLLRHARDSAARLDDWALWNPYLNSTEYAAEGRKPADAKSLSMLHSGIPVLQKKAAGQVINDGTKDGAVYDAIAEELTVGAAIKPRDGTHVDAMGWLCKALGSSHQAKYKEVLEKVRDTSPNSKIRRHAGNALKAL